MFENMFFDLQLFWSDFFLLKKFSFIWLNDKDRFVFITDHLRSLLSAANIFQMSFYTEKGLFTLLSLVKVWGSSNRWPCGL